MSRKLKLIIGGILILILGYLFRTPIFILATMEQKEITVEKTYIKKIKNKDYFFIETKGGEKIMNKDCFWVWKWDSGDIDTELKEDSTYTINVYGIRSNFWNYYKNISSIEK
jgi:hypothetical protein